MNEAFQLDCLERLTARAAQGGIDRRRFTQLAGALLAGLPAALRVTAANAAAKQLVFVNWGGDATKAYTDAYGKAFQQATGIAVRQDGSGPTEGGITAQFKSGRPSWDIVDADPFSAISLGKQGMIETIDWGVVDRGKIRPGFVWDYAASSYFYSYVIAYDSRKYPTAPAGMADFFDTAKFPGKRAMYKWGAGMWEAALLADGVPPDKLYPLDLDRAHRVIAKLKPDVISFWGGGAESQSALLDNEASMALVWSTRASLVEQDSDGRIKYIWDQGLLSPGAMAVIKHNPAGRDNAMKFIASAQDPRKQLMMFDLLGQGPANPACDALIPVEKRRGNCVDPANVAKQVALDMPWYSEHYGAALDTYTKVISA